MVRSMHTQALAPLWDELPSAAEIAAMVDLDEADRAAVPIVAGRLAPPFELHWEGESVVAMRLEIYKHGSPLAKVSQAIYRNVLSHPASLSWRSWT